jgi:hypothetical protein
MEKAEARNAEEYAEILKKQFLPIQTENVQWVNNILEIHKRHLESYASLREAQAVEKFKKELNDKLVQWIKESYRITNDGGPSLARESSMFDEMSNEEIEAQAKGFKEVRREFGLIQPPDHENR